MELGTAFVLEIPEKREDEILRLLKTRIWNYPVIKKMLFGWFITSLDGIALTIPSDYGWDDFCKTGITIRKPTYYEGELVASMLQE